MTVMRRVGRMKVLVRRAVTAVLVMEAVRPGRTSHQDHSWLSVWWRTELRLVTNSPNPQTTLTRTWDLDRT